MLVWEEKELEGENMIGKNETTFFLLFKKFENLAKYNFSLLYVLIQTLIIKVCVEIGDKAHKMDAKRPHRVK